MKLYIPVSMEMVINVRENFQNYYGKFILVEWYNEGMSATDVRFQSKIQTFDISVLFLCYLYKSALLVYRGCNIYCF